MDWPEVIKVRAKVFLYQVFSSQKFQDDKTHSYTWLSSILGHISLIPHLTFALQSCSISYPAPQSIYLQVGFWRSDIAIQIYPTFLLKRLNCTYLNQTNVRLVKLYISFYQIINSFIISSIDNRNTHIAFLGTDNISLNFRV